LRRPNFLSLAGKSRKSPEAEFRIVPAFPGEMLDVLSEKLAVTYGGAAEVGLCRHFVERICLGGWSLLSVRF
jgi:hypothetical protein